MTLGQKQRLFGRYLSKLLIWLLEHKYEFAFGEVKRSNEQAEINAIGTDGRAKLVDYLRREPTGLFLRLADCIADNTGSGIRNSLHELLLAADISLFVNGVYLEQSESYRAAGEYWESLDPLCVWGGRFNDGNHFSMTHEGRK